jgi:DUF971 family protein
MSTRCSILVKVNREDLDKRFKFDVFKIHCPIEDVDGETKSQAVVVNRINKRIREVALTWFYAGIYHHNDGYVTNGVGETLFKEYNTYESALNLVLGGDASSINGHYCSYAGRTFADKWEDIKPRLFESPQSIVSSDSKFVYVFENGKWYVAKVRYDKLQDKDVYDFQLVEDILKRGDEDGDYTF